MKKSLTTAAMLCLAALEAGAAALSVSDDNAAKTYLNGAIYSANATGGSMSNPVDLTSLWNKGEDNCITLTATLDIPAFSKYVGTGGGYSSWNSWNSRLTLFKASGENGYVGVDMFIYNYENGVTGLKPDGGTNNFSEGGPTDPMPHHLESVDFSGVDSAAITFSYNDKNSSIIALTLISGDTVTHYWGTSNGTCVSQGIGAIESVAFNSEVVTSLSVMDKAFAAGVERLNVAAIQQLPEPATATLSLLALAGLAARRRRK